jgi:hypothetical protein
MTVVQLYGKFAGSLLGGYAGGDALQMDYLSDVIKCTLHTSAYVPNIDTHQVYADATNELGTAFGYTNGGATLGTKTVAYTAAGNITTVSDAVISWTAAGGSLVFQYAVFRDSTVATGPLIGYIDCGAQTITTGNIFQIDPTASGLYTLTVT